jgi:hypothetical protein
MIQVPMLDMEAQIRTASSLTPRIDTQRHEILFKMMRRVEVAEVALHGDFGVAPVVKRIAEVAGEGAGYWREESGGLGRGEYHGARQFYAAAYEGVEEGERCERDFAGSDGRVGDKCVVDIGEV